MSDPMSNREIEDVLTSIRRLVAQEGDRAPDAGRGAKGRLVLTEAQRIDPAPLMPGQRVVSEAPILLTAQVAPEGIAAPAEEQHDGPIEVEVTIPAPDFGRLEATIAELEAAVSASGDGFEGAESDEAPKASNVTELYGRLSFAHRTPSEPEAKPVVKPTDEAAPVMSIEPKAEATPAAASAPETSVAAEPPAVEATAASMAEAEGAAEDAALDETILDEEGLRDLIAQIVREELRGALGERITQQVRKLVRAEVAKALDDRGFL